MGLFPIISKLNSVFGSSVLPFILIAIKLSILSGFNN